jgi:succinate dehydrogenase / fumarate reductase iron-sulfur subunit
MKRTFSIRRFDAAAGGQPGFQAYEVECEESWTILDALNHIRWRMDATLSFRRSCRSAICGSCAMTICGENSLACKKQVRAFSGVITLEPLAGFPVLKDLVVDMDQFLDRVVAVKPWFMPDRPAGDKERLQSPADHRKIEEAANCILCGSCTSSCPSYWYNKDYLGPSALLKAYRFIFDSRDGAAAERLDIIDDRNGAWRCHTAFNCVEACPKSLNPTAAIAEIKKAAVSRRI